MNKIPNIIAQSTKPHVASECLTCGNNLPFQIPDHIIEDLKLGRIVLFAGAGISTENKTVFPYSFYADIKEELGISPSEKISFPDTMSRYCAQPNGRAKLLRKIQERFDYIESFPELDRNACRFHAELSTIFQIDTIITTNWDDYFERECGARPFVTAEDFALWNVPGRKVFKIHGSINNYGSIIATAEDYKSCYERLRDGILGGVLKQIIGTKTVIYVGYSFRDEDFTAIYHFLKQEMGSLLPNSYIVTLDTESDSEFRAMGLTPIHTDATYFVSVLKKHLVLDRQMLDDKRFEGIFPELLERIMAEHAHFLVTRVCRENPNSVYVLAYQDGLDHAFSRMVALKDTGYYSDVRQILNLIDTYMQIRKDKLKIKAYFDVAYVDGYIEGLFYLLSDDKERRILPLYYIFGSNERPRSLSNYRQTLKKAHKVHKAAYLWAEKVLKQIRNKREMAIHHQPFLLD